MTSVMINTVTPTSAMSGEGRMRMVLHRGAVEPLNDENPEVMVVFMPNVLRVWWWERDRWHDEGFDPNRVAVISTG